MTKARVIEVHRTNYIVKTDTKEFTATVRGNFHAEGDFPKVGDYVELELLKDEKAVIEKVQERTSVVKRKAADSEEEQIMAANVDTIFIVMGLDGDYSVSRLERYLLLSEQSSVEAVVVLNKMDVVEDVDTYLDEIMDVAGKVPVISVSALSGEGMEELLSYLKKDSTSVLLGSSGAGKSTITNWLLHEDRQPVKDVRDDDSRGRHTTTSRQLFCLSNGAFLIDTPGMRELGVIESDTEDEMAVFNKIEEFSTQCKFSNCDHDKSDGCAVLSALESGDLTERELNNYHKIIREREFQENKGSNSGTRHQAQTLKRRNQQHSAIQKQKLSRRL
jgi:ribosome biogenesis GTPase